MKYCIVVYWGHRWSGCGSSLFPNHKNGKLFFILISFWVIAFLPTSCEFQEYCTHKHVKGDVVWLYAVALVKVDVGADEVESAGGLQELSVAAAHHTHRALGADDAREGRQPPPAGLQHIPIIPCFINES